MSTAVAVPEAWSDSKRYLWLLGLPILLLPLAGWGLVSVTGNGAFWWFAPAFVYTVLPFLDWRLGADPTNLPDAALDALERDRYYRRAVYAAVPVQIGVFVWGCWAVGTLDLAWWEYLGVAISVGGVSGGAINTAHELGHKTDPFERWLAKLSLAQVAYGHFFVEHNRGHHVRVATPEDPASSRFGESFYAFLPRTVFGSLRSAWDLERRRLERRGRSVWNWRNENLQAWAMSVVLFGAVTAAFGPKILAFLVIQAVYGASLLEVVNYLEHYGLCRQRGPDGRYERCEPRHSWNSNHIVTNLTLYQLQRHSDHHANPTRSFQSLRHFDEAPQLPSGYASMVLVAYVPWLWFRIMDPKVVAHYGGDMRKANIRPDLREAVIARHARA